MQNMSKVSKLLLLVVASIALVSCGGSDAPSKVKIQGTIAGAPSSKVILEKFGIGGSVIIDSLMTDSKGNFVYELDVEAGDPQILYVHGAEEPVALLLESGNNVSFTVDADGNVGINGSEESVKLTQLEKEYRSVMTSITDLSNMIDSTSSQQYVEDVLKKINAEYVNYHKSSVKYVTENMSSMTSVPVLYRYVGDAPLFSKPEDAIKFSMVADSLLAAYPSSKLAMDMREDADRRVSSWQVAEMVKNTEPQGYYDIELPGLDGEKKKLSDLDAKVILLCFWTASDGAQNRFNVDVLKPLYEKYHEKGFDIYQVSLDVDKTLWATTVLGQKLPWTNVCDKNGVYSEHALKYNLETLPYSFIISDDELVYGGIVDKASYEELLDELLK